MGVQNPGYLYIAVLLLALSSASTLFSTQMGSIMGLAPASVQAPMHTLIDGLAALLFCAGVTIFILAFLESPGGGGGGRHHHY